MPTFSRRATLMRPAGAEATPSLCTPLTCSALRHAYDGHCLIFGAPLASEGASADRV